MPITVVCPHCGSSRSLDEEPRGQAITCDACQASYLVGTPVQGPLEVAEEFTEPESKSAERVAPTPPKPSPRTRGGHPGPGGTKARSPAPRPRTRARSRSPLLWTLGLGCGLVLLVVVVVAGVLGYAWISGSKMFETPKPSAAANSNAALPQGDPLRMNNQQPDPIQPNAGGQQGQGEGIVRVNSDIGRKIYSRLLKSTVLIVNTSRVGGQEAISVGCGTLVDRTNRLILTNYHVAGRSHNLYVFFPLIKDGKLVADFQYFVRQMDDQRNVLHGKSVYPVPDKDLALVQVDRLPPDALALPLAKDRPDPTDPVYSVGHPGASGQIVGLWIFTAGTIRQLKHMHWQAGRPPEEVFNIDADIVLTNSQTNHGDSGGPLVNSHGDLVAVTQGAFQEGNALSIFIDATEARSALRRYANEYTVKLDLPSGPAVQGDISGVVDLLDELKDADAGKRRKAAVRLGEFGSDAKMAVPDLIVTLKDKDEKVRHYAERALDRIGAPSKAEVNALVKIVADPNVDVRVRALDALAGVGPEAEGSLPALLKAVKETDPRMRAHAVHALGRAGAHAHDRVMTPLAEAAKDRDKSVRVAAAEALAGELQLDAGDVPVLLDLLHQPDVEVRVEGAHVARKLGPDAREARPLLLTALKDANTDLRRAAMEALVEVGLDKDALPALEAALKDKDYEVRRHAMAAAVKLGPDARPVAALVAGNFKDWRLRAPTLEALTKLGPAARDEKVMLVLNEALVDEQFQLPAAAAVAAIHPTGPEGKTVVPRLISLIEQAPTPANKPVRDRAMEALGKTGKNALPDLQKLLKDSRPHVRMAAAAALGEMGADARPALPVLTLLEAGDENAQVRVAANTAIKKISP